MSLLEATLNIVFKQKERIMKTQMLLDLANYLDTKDPEKHNMLLWHCGTTSCAVGDLMIQGKIDNYTNGKGFFVTSWCSVSQALGITIKQALFLFAANSGDWRYRDGKSRIREIPKETAARIRKFVYYKLKKAELWDARDKGHVGICQKPYCFDSSMLSTFPMTQIKWSNVIDKESLPVKSNLISNQ